MSKQQMTVIGGGLLGSAVAYGAAREGLSVRILDQGDSAHRASRGNFGLVWIHGKGANRPEYVRWTREGIKLWPELQQELFKLTGVDSGLEQPGGFWFGFSDKEVRERADKLERINKVGGDVPFEMMDAHRLKEFFPELGSAVVGGSYCPLDGQANPLMLMRALQAALQIKGVDTVSNVDVATIHHDADSRTFNIVTKDGQSWKSDRVVLAAGLGNAALAPQVGLHAAVTPTKGQVLITERMKPFLDYPTNKCRQTKEGSVQLGSTAEQVGYDDATSPDKIELLARRAVETFPILGNSRLVRAWGSLRPLTPDGYPIYQESEEFPGAYLVSSHSGVTLAAAHCYILGPWASGLTQTPVDLVSFKGERFLNTDASFSNDY